MPQVTVEQFAGRRSSDIPHLFSQTRDFSFHSGRGRLVHRKLPQGPKGYSVVAVTSTGHEAGFVEHNRVALTIPIAGRSEVRVANRTVVTRPGEMFAIGPSMRKSNLIPQGQAGLYRSFTIISPSRNATALNEESWLHRPNFHSYLQLKHFIEFCFEAFSAGQDNSAVKTALIEALIEDMFLDALIRDKDETDQRSDINRYDRVVRKAQAYIEAYFGDPISMSDIANAIGVGTRTLQMAFRNRCGMTPKQSLTEFRIRAMRNCLIHPESTTTVSTAAMASGLLHLGRCGVSYRELYGESPSETLRRARSSR